MRGWVGSWHEDRGEIEHMILDYFVKIYSSEQPSNHEVKVEGVTPRISAEMNSKLLEEFWEDEVRTALRHMHPMKAPRPEGMPPIFYKKYWDVVGGNVINCVLNTLNSGRMP